MAHRYSAAFRRATQGAEDNPDADFQERIVGLFEPGTSEEDKEKYWKDRGEKERTMLARNSCALRRRPPSPTLGYGAGERRPTADDEHYAPQLPLTTNPNYDFHIKLLPLGPSGQFIYYQSNLAHDERSPSYLRVGVPFYLVRMAEELASQNARSSAPFLNKDLEGRFFLVSTLFKKEHKSLYKKMQKAIVTATHSFDPSHSVFRGDLLRGLARNFTDQDDASGFLALVGTNVVERRAYRANGEEYIKREQGRAYDVLFNCTKMNRLLPTRDERDTMRMFLGTNSDCLPSDCSLMTLDDFFMQTQSLCILPKKEKTVHSIVAINDGMVIGTVIFIGKLKPLLVKLGEHVITDENYALVSKIETDNRGPTVDPAAYTPTPLSLASHRMSEAAGEAGFLWEEQLKDRREQLKEELAAAQAVYPETTVTERKTLAKYFNVRLRDALARKVLENKEFVKAFRSYQGEIRKAANIAASREDVPDEPGFVGIPMGSSRLQSAHAELERYRRQVDLDENSPAAREERQLRALMHSMGFIWTRPSADQTWTVMAKRTDLFLGCEACGGRPRLMQSACQCLREWMRKRRGARHEDNTPKGVTYSGCNDCRFDLFKNAAFCTCVDEVLRRFDNKKRKACILCDEIELCQCSMVIDLHNLDEPQREVLSDRFSLITNPEFEEQPGYPFNLGRQEDYQELNSDEVAFLAGMEPTPDTWQGSGKVPGVLPERHVKYPRNAGQELVEPNPRPLEPGSRARSFQRQLDRSFERCADLGNDCLVCDPESTETSSSEASSSASEDWPETAASTSYDGRKYKVAKSTDAAPSIVESHPQSTDSGAEKLNVLKGISHDFSDAEMMAEQLVNVEHRPEDEHILESYSTIPGICYPVDARTLERIPGGIPQSRDSVDKSGALEHRQSTYSLFSTPLRSNKTLNLANPRCVQERYLKRTKTGRYYNPTGSLYRLLEDTCGVQIMDPIVPASEEEKKKLVGEAAYEACKAKNLNSKDAEKRATRTVLRIESMRMLTPTDVPSSTNRQWLYSLSVGDAHGSNPLEFFLCIIAQINYFHRYWEETQDDDGQRYLKIRFPGRESGSFAVSVGAPWNTQNIWKIKIAGRQAAAILCGAGTPETTGSAKKKGVTEESYLRKLQNRQMAQVPLVQDSTEGSDSSTRRIADHYRPESLVGEWMQLSKAENVPYSWLQVLWEGFGFEWSCSDSEELGYRLLLTCGKKISLEKIKCLYGLAYWLLVKQPELKTEYEAYAKKHGGYRRDKAFTECRFAIGLLNPSWHQYMDLLPRIFGSSWESHLKTLLFRLQLGCNDMWLPGTHRGPLSQEFLGLDYDSDKEESEIIGRITESGQFIAMSEEPEYATQWPGEDVVKQCYGHMISNLSAHKRPPQSKKNVSTREFECNETL